MYIYVNQHMYICMYMYIYVYILITWIDIHIHNGVTTHIICIGQRKVMTLANEASTHT